MTVPITVRLVKGTRLIKIHYFARDENGPIRTRPANDLILAAGQQRVPIPKPMRGGARGLIACQPGRSDLNKKTPDGRTELLPRSDDVRAVTCPDCMATDVFKDAVKFLTETLAETD